MAASGGVNLAAGPAENYQGNRVPFTGTVTMEQNPTISHAPVTGDRIMRQLMGDTPVDLVILL